MNERLVHDFTKKPVEKTNGKIFLESKGDENDKTLVSLCFI